MGPFYDEGADLKDELWVTEKYLRHHHPKTTTKGTEDEPSAKKKATTSTSPTARPDDWTSDRNDPLTRPRRSDAVLSCPCCFTPLCYDCQRHDVYLSQYRAMVRALPFILYYVIRCQLLYVLFISFSMYRIVIKCVFVVWNSSSRTSARRG